MTEQISFIGKVNTLFWGDGLFQWWFYLAIIIVLFLEKRKMEKRVYGIYPICFLLLLVTPVTAVIMKKVAAAQAYYARLYSMLPIPYMLAISFILVVELLCSVPGRRNVPQAAGPEAPAARPERRPWLKLVLTAGICAVIAFCGTEMFGQRWVKAAENAEKVPKEAIQLCEALAGEKDATVAVPDYLVAYVRQVDAGLYMPYGRAMNALGRELSKAQPDPAYAMKEAGREACDFIVVTDSPENRESFAEKGWVPWGTIDYYMIFEVTGVKRTKNYYDDNHRLIRKTTLDEMGNPIAGSKGYASVCYEYDRANNRVLESWLDENGEPFVFKKGYAAIRRSYTPFAGLTASETYLDADGQPVMAGAYAEIRYVYGRDRKPVRESYYDGQGNPLMRADKLYAAREMSYNADGKVTGEKYFDTEGKPCTSSAGYAEYRKEFNEKKKLSRETYWDGQGQPAAVKDGSYGFAREYDDGRHMVTEIYLDAEGKEAPVKAGYSRVQRQYDSAGNMICESYFLYDARFTLKKGYHSLTREYDENGKAICENYFDDDDVLVNCRDGYATLLREYDSRGKLVKEEYFDVQGNAVQP